jgi:hypothetical protein
MVFDQTIRSKTNKFTRRVGVSHAGIVIIFAKITAAARRCRARCIVRIQEYRVATPMGM